MGKNTKTIHAVLIRNNGQTITFQAATWKAAGESAMTDVVRAKTLDDAHQIVRFVFSIDDRLVEHTENEVAAMADGTWAR